MFVYSLCMDYKMTFEVTVLRTHRCQKPNHPQKRNYVKRFERPYKNLNRESKPFWNLLNESMLILLKGGSRIVLEMPEQMHRELDLKGIRLRLKGPVSPLCMVLSAQLRPHGIRVQGEGVQWKKHKQQQKSKGRISVLGQDSFYPSFSFCTLYCVYPYSSHRNI